MLVVCHFIGHYQLATDFASKLVESPYIFVIINEIEHSYIAICCPFDCCQYSTVGVDLSTILVLSAINFIHNFKEDAMWYTSGCLLNVCFY